MRSPLQAWRDFRDEFRTVMDEHEAHLLRELAPTEEQVERATARRSRPAAAQFEGITNHEDEY